MKNSKGALGWLDCRGLVNDKHVVLAIGDIDTPWIVILTDHGGVKLLPKSKVTSLVTE